MALHLRTPGEVEVEERQIRCSTSSCPLSSFDVVTRASIAHRFWYEFKLPIGLAMPSSSALAIAPPPPARAYQSRRPRRLRLRLGNRAAPSGASFNIVHGSSPLKTPICVTDRRTHLTVLIPQHFPKPKLLDTFKVDEGQLE
jgi:hypothetical protein